MASKVVRIGQVDMATGEMLDGPVLAVMYPKRRNGFSDGWVAMGQNPMVALAKADLGKEASRVLFLLLGRLDFENWINLNQAEMAAELTMQRQNVSRALKELASVGVILVGPKVGRNSTFRVNPKFGWKGSAKGHNEALTDRMRARGFSLVTGGVPETSEDVQGVADDRTRDLFED